MRLSTELLTSWLKRAFPLQPVTFPDTTLWLDLPTFYTGGDIRAHGLYILSQGSPDISPEAGACIVDCRGPVDGSGFPVGCHIVLAESADERRVMNSLVACFSHYADWLERLHHAAQTGNLKTMADICSEESDNLFLVADEDCQPLAASTAGTRETADSIDRHYDLYPVVTAEDMLHFRNTFDTYRNRTEPYMSESIAMRNGRRLPLMVQNLQADHGGRLGFILFLATGHELGPCDAHLLQLAAPLLERAMAARGQLPSSGIGHLFRTVSLMLDGRRIPVDMAAQAETAAGFSEMRKRCFVVYLPTDSADEFARFCIKRLSDLYDRCLVVPRTDALVVITPAGTGNRTEAEDVRTMESFLEEMGLYAGASDPFDHIADLLGYYEEARMSGRFVYEIPKGSRVHFFSDYRLPYLISNCASAVPAPTYMPEGLARVLAYNETAAVDYVETLQVFFEEGGNTAACARRLGISRNTLLPRLERLRSLLGSNLEDPEERFLLELCLKMRASALRNNG